VRIGIAIATIATLFLSLYQILVPIFQKHLKIIYVSFAELINRIIYVGLAAFFLLKIKTGLIPIMWAMAISALVNFLLVFYFARRFDKIRLRFNWARWKKILREALPVGASIIFTLIYFRIDTIMLSLMKAPQDVGIYGLSYKILENLIFFPAMFVGFVVPILSRYVFKKIDKFKKVFQLSLNAILLAAIPLVAALIIAAPLIITFLAGEAFIASSKVLQILAIAVGFIFLGSLYGQTVIIVKKQFWSMWVYLAGAVFNVLANLYFISRYSYIGAAITTALTEFIITLALIIIVSKTLHYHASFKIGIKAIAATLPMAVFLYYFQNLHIIILAILSILIYAFFIYLLRGISKEDFSLLSKKTAP
jgi:O-antigen/teichoic acid export membrane protein